MVFPCPGCFYPLAARVEPELDLQCPKCGTAFRVPAPTVATAPGPNQGVPVGVVQNNGFGILNQALFGMGLIAFPISYSMVFLGFDRFLPLSVSAVFLLGVFGSRFKNYLNRQQNPEVLRLTWRGLCHEGFQAVGAVAIGALMIPCFFGALEFLASPWLPGG